MRRLLLVILFVLPLLGGGGCGAFYLAGGMAQSFEYQKLVEVLPRYEGLEHKTVAVIVDADLGTLHQYQLLPEVISSGVGGLIAREVSGARVLTAGAVREWQFTTPRWNALPYSDMLKALQVERIILIDIHTFRLNPPGNRWIWEGECAATIGVIEDDGHNPDEFADAYHITARFPTIKQLDRDSASSQVIETGLVTEFMKQTAWLFYPHLEPKYPDRYKPELDQTQ